MTGSSAAATAALDPLNDAQVLNMDQQRKLFRPETPECDSLGEFAAGLVNFGVPHERVVEMVDMISDLLKLNAEEGYLQGEAAAVLDRVRCEMHAAGVRSAITVTAVAKAISPHLKVLRNPGAFDGVAYYQASCAIKRLCERHAPEDLLMPNLANHIGPTGFKFFAKLVEAHS
jgi:hypothetical protein